ncbi:hypothetical protein DFAR_680005 [Desulfarculales bacterium]
MRGFGGLSLARLVACRQPFGPEGIPVAVCVRRSAPKPDPRRVDGQASAPLKALFSHRRSG